MSITKPPRPNLLFILTDQQRFDTLLSHGGLAHTPNIDKLAAKGVDLRSHYAQSPNCMPSRCSLFTGRYAHSHRVLENFSKLADHEVHLLKVLKQNDYWLAYHGKNHFIYDSDSKENLDRYSDPELEIFSNDEFIEMRNLMQNANNRLEQVGSWASAEYHDLPDDSTCTGMIAKEAIAALQEAPEQSPWCVVTSFHDPHVPHLAPRRFEKLHPKDQMKIPDLPDNDIFAGKPPRMRIKYQAQFADRATDDDKRQYLSVYHSMCSFIDEQVGKILDALNQRADSGQTIIVFTSDHGDFAWHHGLCKKDLLLYEDLLHVPAVISWPEKIKPALIENTFTEHVDWVPTLLDLMDIDIPFGCQGISFAPLLRGKTDQHRNVTFAEVCYPWMKNPYKSYDEFIQAWKHDRSTGGPLSKTAPFNVPGDYTKGLRTQDFSYNWYSNGFEELYDLKNDPGEYCNLAFEDKYATTLNNMRLQLMEWFMCSADPRTPRIEAEQARQFNKWKYPIP